MDKDYDKENIPQEDTKDCFKYTSREAAILPMNERTIKKRKQMEEEYLRQKRLEEFQKRQEEEQERLMQQMNEQERQQHLLKEKKKTQRAQKLKEEKNYLEKIQGQFALLLKNVFNSQISKEFSFSQYNLSSIQKRLFFKAMEFNKSIRNLSIIRNDVNDDNIEDLFIALFYNNYLRKLELSDNELTYKSMEYIKEMLQKNRGLVHLSLEGNNIFGNENENNETNLLKDFLQSLTCHKNLIYVNLSSTNIQDKHLDSLIDYLETQYPTPFLDISYNPISDIQKMRKVQELLIKTKQDFEIQRRNEMVERQEMVNQDKCIRSINSLNNHKNNLMNSIQQEAIQQQDWREKLLKEKLQNQQEADKRLGNRLEKDALIRATKKTKKRKKKKQLNILIIIFSCSLKSL